MGADLTQGNIYKTIIKTAMPMVIAFSFQSVFNLVDAFFVGKISSEALAAVSIGFPIIFLIIALGTGIGAGATSVISRHIGSKEIGKADNAAIHGIIISTILGILLTIAGLYSAPYLIDIIGAEGEVKQLALDYLNILLFFSIFMLSAMIVNSIIRGEGDMKTPMKVMVYAAIINVFLDPIFIFVIGWGVKGAAIATVIARTWGLLYLLFHIFRGNSWIKLSIKDFKYHFSYVKSILAVGLPSSLSHVFMSLGMFILTAIVGMFGTDAIAAFGIGIRLDGLAILPGLGVMTAVLSIVGQSIGAGDLKRAREVTWKSGYFSVAIMSFIGFFFYIFAPTLISVFNDSPGVVEAGTSFLRIIPFTYLFVGISMSISGAFLGAGKAMHALVITLLRALILSVPLGYYYSLTMGLPGLWIGISIGTILGVVFSILLFNYSGWDKQFKKTPQVTN